NIAEIAINDVAQVTDFLRRRCRGPEIADKILVGRADQAEIVCEREDEHHAPIGRFQDVAKVILELTAYDNVAALDQPNTSRQRLPDDGVRNSSDPWACGVDEHARGRDAAPAMVAEHELPFFAPLGTGAAGAGPDDGA